MARIATVHCAMPCHATGNGLCHAIMLFLAAMKFASFASAGALALCALTPALLHAQPGQLKLDYVEGLRETEAATPPPAPTQAPQLINARNPAEIEAGTGGMLGIAILDRTGTLLLGFNREERFPLCGSEALPLAAAILRGVADGKLSLGDTLPIPDNIISGQSPYLISKAGQAPLPVGELLQAMLGQGDATARQMLLGYLGGPSVLAHYIGEQSDPATQQQDNTTPLAFAGLVARLFHQQLPAATGQQMRDWLATRAAEQTMIAKGLPQGWSALELPLACDTGLASIALVRSASQQEYVFALYLYLDRPTITPDKGAIALAEAAGSASDILSVIEKRRQ